MNEIEEAAGLAATPGYRYAEQVGNQLFVAGQVPQDGDGSVVAPNDAHRQAEQCLTNLATLLAARGFAPRDIKYLRIYVVGDQPALRDAWSAVKAFFDDDVPPATLLGVHLLGYRDQVVEIDASVLRD